MDRGPWRAAVHGVTKELDLTQQPSNNKLWAYEYLGRLFPAILSLDKCLSSPLLFGFQPQKHIWNILDTLQKKKQKNKKPVPGYQRRTKKSESLGMRPRLPYFWTSPLVGSNVQSWMRTTAVDTRWSVDLGYAWGTSNIRTTWGHETWRLSLDSRPTESESVL